MAAGSHSTPTANGTHEATKAIELAVELPHSPGLLLKFHLTLHVNSVLLFVTTSGPESGQQPAALGSFVYAMPDRYNPTQPMSTALYSSPSSLDFAARLAKVLARRLQKPCYVGSSVNLSAAAAGGSVEEEREAFRSIVEAVSAHATV